MRLPGQDFLAEKLLEAQDQPVSVARSPAVDRGRTVYAVSVCESYCIRLDADHLGTAAQLDVFLTFQFGNQAIGGGAGIAAVEATFKTREANLLRIPAVSDQRLQQAFARSVEILVMKRPGVIAAGCGCTIEQHDTRGWIATRDRERDQSIGQTRTGQKQSRIGRPHFCYCRRQRSTRVSP